MPEQIELINIKDEAERRYLNYALSVITSRALPDVRDGLKPVQRRILFAMDQEGYRSDGKTRKCVGVVGEVNKSYHPHSPEAVYDALARMAQDFVLRYPLVFGEGNFGSVDGDPPAAMRYTECKLTPLAEEMMRELRQQTVDMRPNFDSEKEEPIVLPTPFPSLLANGSQGIAVGMATNIPPHNMGELIKACLVLMDDPESTTAQLVNLARGPIRGPDFPLGGRIIIDQTTLRQIYETGQGAIKTQGEWKLEEDRKPTAGKNGKVPGRRIIIHSIPYGVNKGSLVTSIGEIVEGRKLPMVENVVDETSLANGMRIVLELKPDADPKMVMAFLYKHTSLQDNFNCNFTSLFPAGKEAPQGEVRPRRSAVKEMLVEFIEFRAATVRRRYDFFLAQLRRRIHILEGFAKIFNALDEALKLIRASDGRADSAEKLQKRFGLDEVQSFAVVDLNLYRISKLEINKIREELAEKRAEAERIERILASEKRLRGEVRKELEAFAEKFGDARRTRSADEEAVPEFDPEAFIVHENTNVVVTREGWIKRVGRISSVATTRVREGDEVLAVLPASTRDFAIFLSSDGFAYTIRVDEIPVSSGYGEPLSKYCRLGDGARVVGALTTDRRFTPQGKLLEDKKGKRPELESMSLLVASARGNVLKTPLAPLLTASTKAGRRYARLADAKDAVVFVGVPEPADETMFLISSDGHVIHFPIDQIIELSGVGKGVKGIKLVGNATCLGGVLIANDKDRVYAENTNDNVVDWPASKYTPTSRGGKGYEAIRRGGFKRLLPREIELVDWNQLSDS